MVQALSIAAEIQRVVREALAQADHVETDTPGGPETLTALRREFPQATIVALSVAELLHAVHEAVQKQAEEAPYTAGPGQVFFPL
jgi:hypothetical protein